MVVVASRSPGVVLLLAAALLLTSTATGVAAATGNSSTICDTAKCGKGSCSEAPVPIVPWIPITVPGIVGYKCTCDPGWSQPKLFDLSVDWAPCMIPECTFDSSCYNFSAFLTPPDAISLNPCLMIKCGSGQCKKGEGFFTYTCECNPGSHNFLNQTMLPCMGDCSFGDDCKKLGLYPPAPPPPSTAPPPGSASSWRLLQQLLSLAILLLLQVVV